MTTSNEITSLISSRTSLPVPSDEYTARAKDEAAEGGCGVIGFASTERVAGKLMLQALDQMRNRGNGKGGGVAMAGLSAEEMGVSQEILDQDYLIAVAYLDETARPAVEEKYIHPLFDVDHIRLQPHLEDWRSLPRLEVAPPKVVQYFVRVKPEMARNFAEERGLQKLSRRALEDEIVYQNTYRLNHEFYAAEGETRAFVLSHARNLLVIKMVAFADDVVRYYQLENAHAHVWIGHHRYPTKGRVWHPGGAHPFIGMNEALVHNGDFANYASIAEYLRQRNIHQLYLTDTEVSVQVFDLLRRTYAYPLEYVIEAIAPTTERDFTLLPPEKQRIYQMLQHTHMHASPDGPWFFIIAQSEEEDGSPVYRLTCITDTSMLRPQVFACQRAGEGGPAIGFAASEKQAIDAALASLAEYDDRFWHRADKYWNARGGSHTDGGAFMFSVKPGIEDRESKILICTDKFGQEVKIDASRPPYRGETVTAGGLDLPQGDASRLFDWFTGHIPSMGYATLANLLRSLTGDAKTDGERARALGVLTRLMDRRYPTGGMRRSSLVTRVDEAFAEWVASIRQNPSDGFAYADANTRPPSAVPGQTIVIDARGFDTEGTHSLARALNDLNAIGFQKFVIAHCRGHRFIGNGFGAGSDGVVMDVFGSPGDYLASGLDGMEIRVHASGQDQLSQIMKRGKLVVHGDVGQTFMYGAKGGDAYVLGNAAGRPLINAVGRPRVVINGTALDYLAESFMAGDPHDGGGFVILNGIRLADDGEIVELDTPYPGGNLFSLASGGAIFVRDPRRRVDASQLNGGEFYPFEARDWNLIERYLQENARQFGIAVSSLLEVDGVQMRPDQVYRKIAPVKVRALQAEEAWVGSH
jgi:glutamate synthase domain-containing protein 1/glutamate synthase domain-containing protein 3